MNHKEITVEEVMEMNASSLEDAISKVAKKHDISEEEAEKAISELTEKSDKKLF